MKLTPYIKWKAAQELCGQVIAFEATSFFLDSSKSDKKRLGLSQRDSERKIQLVKSSLYWTKDLIYQASLKRWMNLYVTYSHTTPHCSALFNNPPHCSPLLYTFLFSAPILHAPPPSSTLFTLLSGLKTWRLKYVTAENRDSRKTLRFLKSSRQKNVTAEKSYGGKAWRFLKSSRPNNVTAENVTAQ